MHRPLLILLLIAPSLRAAEPTISNLNIRGLTIGGTTTITVDGADLAPNPRLLLPFPAKQELQPKATNTQAIFAVTLAPDVTPGYHHLRVVTDQGVSLPFLIAVDRMPQIPFAKEIPQLPAAIHGVIGGSATAETTFPGKAGQKISIDVEAQRLGSKLRPVVHLINPKGLQTAWSWPTTTNHGDTRLDVALPMDGVYTLTLHDQEYAAQAPPHFRLKVGDFATIDQVFPPAATRGTPASIELIGSTTQKVDLSIPPGGSNLPLAWPKDGLWSGLRPYVRISSHPELVEQPTAAKGQELPAGRVAASGKLTTPFEEDLYVIPVKPGVKYKLEVFADRLGSPLDVALAVRNEAGAQLARAEDSPGSFDPVTEFTPPAKTDKVILAVIDAQGRGGPRGLYRLKVEPQKTVGDDFKLVTNLQRISLNPGGRAVLPVLAPRDGYRGPVNVSVEALPPGFRAENNVIPPDTDGTLLTIVRDQTPAADAIVTRLHGKADGGLEQTLTVQNHPLERLQPWLAQEIAFAPTNVKSPDFAIDWRDLPADAAIKLSRKLTLPIKVKHGEEKSPVKLTLLTSQLPVIVNNQPDPNQLLRVEKAVELAPKMSDGELVVLVPPALAGPMYDVAIHAELLSADKKTVLASATTPVRRLEARSPLVVKLEGDPRREVTLDPKKDAVVKLSGTIERRDELTGDVIVALAGLPANIKANPVTVKAADTAFAMDVTVPPTFASGELAAKLSVSGVPDQKQAAIRVKSRDVDVTFVIK